MIPTALSSMLCHWCAYYIILIQKKLEKPQCYCMNYTTVLTAMSLYNWNQIIICKYSCFKLELPLSDL